jgi:Domain of unknown function (DUF4158)
VPSFLEAGDRGERHFAMRREWELEDLIECWTLNEADLGLIANKSRATRLGFALALKFFEQEARFPGMRASCRLRR